MKHTNYFQSIKLLQGEYYNLSITGDKIKDQRDSVTHPGSLSSNTEFIPN